jgi:hypothetical protein
MRDCEFKTLLKEIEAESGLHAKVAETVGVQGELF